MDGEILSDEENHNLEMDMDNENSNPRIFSDDEAIEVPEGDPNKKKVIIPKAVTRNPQPKLDALRLMGPRGIGILPNTFKSYKFKGKGYEKQDLNVLMKQLEHWSHRLFPKLTFDDMLTQLEKLGFKRNVQIIMKKMRMDILQSDELIQENANVDTEVIQTEDIFDKLLPSDGLINQDAGFTFSSVTESQPQPRVISAEDRERMERNKELALEKRRSNILERGNNSINFSQTFASQSESIISSANMADHMEDDFDENMLKEFDETPDKLYICSPTKNDTIKETSTGKDTSQLDGETCMEEENSDKNCSINSKEKISPEKYLNYSNTDKKLTKTDDICTVEDVIDNL